MDNKSKVKKPWLAALLNLILMGAGYIYVNKVFVGVLFIIAEGFTFLPGFLLSAEIIELNENLALLSLSILCIRIAITYDAYTIAQEQ